MAVGDRKHYRGPHRRLAKAAVEAAKADPTWRCPRCGQPRDDERYGPLHGGHIVDGDTRYGYQAEHQSCNDRAGQALAVSRKEPKSRDW